MLDVLKKQNNGYRGVTVAFDGSKLPNNRLKANAYAPGRMIRFRSFNPNLV